MLAALPPIGLGHALLIAVVASGFVVAGVLFKQRLVQAAGDLALIGWAVYHQLFGQKHRTRVGMTAGWAGLMRWSFFDGYGAWRRSHAATGDAAALHRLPSGRG